MADIIKAQEALPPVPLSEGAAILSLIERAARDPAVDIAKLERMFELHKAAQARVAETAFNVAMAAAQAELEPIGRTSSNTHTHSRYADLATICEGAAPIIARHGFGLSFGTAEAKHADHIRMVCDVTHAAGHAKRYESEIPYDLAGSAGRVNKTKVQAFGSTTTYGRRYMMMLIFNIATADNDGNAPRGPRKSSAESKRDGTDKAFNEIRAAFAGALNIEHLKHLADVHSDDIETMPERWSDLLREEYALRLDALKGSQA